jgi:hypothetical protein
VPDPAAILLALEATGLSHWNALLALKASVPTPKTETTLLGVPKAVLYPFESLTDAMEVFDEFAATNPAGAHAALNAYLLGSHMAEDLFLDGRAWVTSLPSPLTCAGALDLTQAGITALPANLQVKGHLFLEGTSLAALPPSLQVGGNLNASGTLVADLPANFRVGGNFILSMTLLCSLPPGLVVGGSLGLVACPQWDGVVPADTQVQGRIHTSLHPQGLPLKAWRQAHPYGERA